MTKGGQRRGRGLMKAEFFEEPLLEFGSGQRGLLPNFPPVISRVRRLFCPSWGVLFVVVVSCSYQFFRPALTL